MKTFVGLRCLEVNGEGQSNCFKLKLLFTYLYVGYLIVVYLYIRACPLNKYHIVFIEHFSATAMEHVRA